MQTRFINSDYKLIFENFQLSLYQLNPEYRVKENAEENEKVVQAVTERLCDQSRPSLITLKNQLYFVKHYHDKGKSVFELNIAFKCREITIQFHVSLRRNCQKASITTASKNWTSGRWNLRNQQIGERKGYGKVVSENIGSNNASERSRKSHGLINSEVIIDCMHEFNKSS